MGGCGGGGDGCGVVAGVRVGGLLGVWGEAVWWGCEGWGGVGGVGGGGLLGV